MKPQFPWLQYVEQNSLVVPLNMHSVFIPKSYTPQGIGLYFLIFVTYILLFSYIQSRGSTSRPLEKRRGYASVVNITIRGLQNVGEELV
jgi:hypothetical protein